MSIIKVIVAGGRDFNDYELLKEKINELATDPRSPYKDDEICLVSGMARGADALGYRFAVTNKVVVHCFSADWDKHGKSAGFIRNKQMGDFADVLLAFWDGKSKGTAQMIEYMNQLHKPVFIVRYDTLYEFPVLSQKIKWGRTGGYECSSKGDSRFSALFARMPDGRTIEQHYQCDVKGYQPGGTNWRLGKGKPALNSSKDLWAGYLDLWKVWANNHPDLVAELAHKASESNHTLCDMFASTPVNQARALAEIINTRQ